MDKVKKLTTQKGITLVALIITIIVLLILAVVAIRAVQGDGIISKAKEAAKQTNIAQEKEELQMAVLEWQLVNKNGNPTLFSFLSEKYGEDSVQLNADKSITVTMPSENRYKVTTSGEAILLDGTVEEPEPIVISITLDKTSITKEITSGSTGTETLTATLNNASGELTWKSSDTSVADISGSGNTRTITLKKAGTATITVSYGTANATCSVTITEKVTVEEPIQVGSYVQYNVEYEDMYSGIIYNENNGWRYLGKDDDGNNLIVSTGIPAILYYHYDTNKGNIADGGANSWWATKAEISSENTPAIYRTTKGYDYNTDSGEPNKYAAYGLRYKFESIPFTYQATGTSASTANKGIFRKVGSTISGTDINLNFRANGVNVVDVHNLTLAELNRATNSASGSTRAETSTSSGFKDLTGTANGLFDMQDLENYTQSYYYWLASPGTGTRNSVYNVYNNISHVNVNHYDRNGVRPVVTLPSNVNLTVVNN